MRKGSLILGIAAALLAAAAGWAEATGPGLTDPGGDSVVMRPPQGWVPAQADRDTGMHRQVFLPAGQTYDDWQQKLSIQVFVNFVKRRPELSPADFTENLVRLWQQSCDGLGSSPVSSFAERGYAAAVRLLVCPRTRGSQLGSVAMVKVMQGQASMYLFERSWRGPAFQEKEMPVEQDALDEWAEFLASATLCNPDNADAPCTQAQR